jgi:Asp-tRNA(Asn)/Glu-tRNA(Gln) amidotransferase C subunit
MACLVANSDQIIESLADEMEDIIDLFESIKKPQEQS